MTPTATYRVQFHAGFTFADAAPLAPYWRDLGISHIYASPIAAAREGSMHGYDVIDPTLINRRLGGEAGFRTLVEALRQHGLGVILDIVPNHVAVGGEENAWWLDVLEKGRKSRFACAFDIDWDAPDLEGKILAPFLGADYRTSLQSGDLRLDYERAAGRFSVLAHEAHRFPIRLEDYDRLLEQLGVAERSQITAERIDAAFDPRTPQGLQRLDELLERQHYRLADWRSAARCINWRRFFDITELAALRIEDPEVFAVVHALPLRLYAMGLIDGLRVDHVDGLSDPAGYCRRLRHALNAAATDRPEGLQDRAYLVVEKILGDGEALPDDWEVDGTTGYEFMNEVAALLHEPSAAAPLANFWVDTSARAADFESEEALARAEMLETSFTGQLTAVARAFCAAFNAAGLRSASFTEVREAVQAYVEGFRVYRTYSAHGIAPGHDAAHRTHAMKRAIDAAPNHCEIIVLIGQCLAGEAPGDPRLTADAVRRFQQLTAPVAAKAVEDTAFYRYGRLISRNDVGSDPGRFATSPSAFLRLAAERGRQFPSSLLSTATHDHKRGEDARARLAALSEVPDLWIAFAKERLEHAGAARVAPADALMLLQSLVSSWPMDQIGEAPEDLEELANRLAGWQTKALREAKLRSSWIAPDLAYERTCETYLRSLLGDGRFADERRLIAEFVASLAPAGVAKSLVQTGLRLTLPGTPDTFQGCEHWDFSLVDPDNRRPVDYRARRASLVRSPASWRDGALKQGLIRQVLRWRKEHPAVFRLGVLEQLPLEGHRAGEAMAFQRRSGADDLVVVCALQTTVTCMLEAAPRLPERWWGDTAVRFTDGTAEPLSGFSGSKVFAARLRSRDGQVLRLDPFADGLKDGAAFAAQ